MKLKSPAFSIYVKDHLGSARVAELTIEEEGYYLRALLYSWQNEGMPADSQRFANIVGKGCTVEIARRVQRMFKQHPRKSEILISERQELERTKQKHNSAKRKEAGRKSGVNRREKRDLALEQNANKNEPFDFSLQSLISITDFKRLIESAASEFSKADKRLVEIGVLCTLIRRNGSTEPIKSAKYFHPEIQTIVKESRGLGDNAIDVMLARRREQYFGDAK